MARAYTSGVVTGIAVSLAAAVLAPVWRPALSRWGRPALKGAIKQGVVVYAVLRERASEMGENVSDLLAEAQVELATERTGEGDDVSVAPAAAAE
jgi:Protein of unknown function (DUF5132)